MKIHKRRIFITVLSLMLVIVGCSSGQTSTKQETSKNSGTTSVKGEELRIAINAQPPTLDLPINTSTDTRDMALLIYETLVTTNSKYEPVPMLAESIDTSDDSRTYTFHLRKGVKFHNGKEMTAEDVVASMDRWMEKSTLTGEIFDGATFEAKDDHTVVLQLAQSSALALDIMASTKMGAAIMPKEVVEDASPEGVSEYIGTGPYKFVEWKQDQYLHFTKFDEYQPVETEADGASGKKEALIDDIYFDIVTDSSTRLAGLMTGEYDIAYRIPHDNYEQVKDDPELEVYAGEGGGDTMMLFYNRSEGLSSDQKMRQAINAALDINEIMLAAFSDEDLFWLDPGYMNRNISNWASDAGSEFFNLNDLDLAKELLDEAGYNGEEFRLLTTRDYEELYDMAVVVQEQLKQIGVNVELQVYDVATYLDKFQNEPDSWDAFMTSVTPVSVPPQLLALSDVAGGLDSKSAELLESLQYSDNLEEAQQLWDELQGYLWEQYLPVTAGGGYKHLYVASNKVEGFSADPEPIFWNVTFAE